MDNIQLIKTIFKNKLDQEVVDVKRTVLGENNTNYFVETQNGRYLFKIFSYKPNNRELYNEIYNLIADKKVHLPKIINSGTLDNVKYYQIQEYITGSTAWDLIMAKKLSFSKYVEYISTALDTIHSINITQNTFKDMDIPPSDRQIHMTKIVESVNSKDGEGAKKIIRDSISKISDNVLSELVFKPVLVHGDPAPDNLMIDQSNRIYMIDWDNARISDPLEDYAFLLHRGAYFRHYKTPNERNQIIRSVFPRTYNQMNLESQAIQAFLEIYIDILELKSKLKP